MAQTKELGVKLNAQTGGFNQAMARAASSVGKVGAAVAAAGAMAAGALGATAVGAAMDYEKAMADVKAASGATESEMDKLKSKAAELAKSSKFMITDIAGAEKTLVKMGLSAEETTQALGGITAAAAASDQGLQETADQIMGVARGYGLAAEKTTKVSDVLAKTAMNSGASIRSLAEGFKYIGPIASRAGIKLEEMSAMLGTLATNNIRAGQAGRQLRTAMLSFQKMEGKAFTPEEIKKFKEAGIEMDNLSGLTKNAEARIKALSTNVDGLSLEKLEAGKYDFREFVALLSEAGATSGDFASIFTKRAATALEIIGQNNDKLGTFKERLKDSAGAAQQMARTQLDSLAGQLTILRGSWNYLMVTIGNKFLPFLQNVTQNGVIPFVNSMSSIIKESDSFREFFYLAGEQYIPGFDKAIKRIQTEGFLKWLSDITPSMAEIGEAASNVWDSIKQWGGEKLEWAVDLKAGEIGDKVADWTTERVSWFIDLEEGEKKKINKWIDNTVTWTVNFIQGTIKFTKKTVKNAIDLGGAIEKEIDLEATLDPFIKWAETLKKAVTSSKPVKNLSEEGVKSPVKMLASVAGVSWGALTAAGLAASVLAKIPGGVPIAVAAGIALAINKIEPQFVKNVSSAIKSSNPIKNLAKEGIRSPVSMTLSIAGLTWALGTAAATIMGAISTPVALGILATTAIAGVKILKTKIKNAQETRNKLTKEANALLSDKPIPAETTLTVGKEGEKIPIEPGGPLEPINFVDPLAKKLKNADYSSITSAVEKLWGNAMEQFSYSWPSIKLKDLSGWAKDVGSTISDINWNKWTTFEGIMGMFDSVTQDFKWKLNIEWPSAPPWLKWIMNHMGWLGISGGKNQTNNGGTPTNGGTRRSQGGAGVPTEKVKSSTNEIANNLSQLADQVSSTAQDFMVLPSGQEFADVISGKYPKLGKAIVADKSTTNNQFDFRVKQEVQNDNTEWILQQLRKLKREIEQSQGQGGLY